jgi:hypothetical protein
MIVAAELNTKEHEGAGNPEALARRFDAPTPEARRAKLLPFLWGTVAREGQHRRYDLYLDAAHRSDRFLRRLWETAQSLPAYHGRTTLQVATDHGRGESPVDWTDHGQKVPAAERIWMAVVGPDTPGRGVRDRVEATQSQLAATVAHLLGEDFRAGVPAAAPPLPGVVR